MGNKWKLFFIMVLLVVFFQQCSRVDLQRFDQISFVTKSSSPFLIPPPTEFPVVRRYIWLVDMSNSMISGPCQNDVEGGMLFSTSPPLTVYDPTKGLGNFNDHRADAIDCQVNEALPIDRNSMSNAAPDFFANPPRFYETFPGIDFTANRLEILNTWVTDLINSSTPEMLENTKVMIVPVSGGKSQNQLNFAVNNFVGIKDVFQFTSLSDPKILNYLKWLKEEHMRNYSLVRSSDVWRFENTNMGTTVPGALLGSIYDTLVKDMRTLNEQGLLSYADYDVVHMTDGYLSPKPNIISTVLQVYNPCSLCAMSPNSCNGSCSTLIHKMMNAWGNPEDNNLNNLDFKLGLIQSLPQFFGAGNLRLNFVQLHKERSALVHPAERTFIDDLVPLFKKRNSHVSVWQANSEKPPFQLLGSYRDSVSYKLTDLFLMNPNLRMDVDGQLQVDTDGDGLFDKDERDSDPFVARSNSYCLDSFLMREAYASRCQSMATARSCDASLDSDGDSLNECEEALLGTDPFDFDTDNDGIPDFFEWIYGFNPLSSDVDKDNNGDGFTNMYNFARGLGPMADIQRASPNALSQFEVNYLSREKIESENAKEMWVESYQVLLRHLPAKIISPVELSKQTQLFASRVSADSQQRDLNRISFEDSLLSFPTQKFTNKMLGLMRLVDRDNPDRVFWRIYKEDIPVSEVISQPRLDLSHFHLIRTRDRGM